MNERVKRSTITLQELVDELTDYLEEHGDKPVLITSDYGDHCHTEQALGVKEVSFCHVEQSAYSSSGYAVIQNSLGEDDEESVIVLRSVD